MRTKEETRALRSGQRANNAPLDTIAYQQLLQCVNSARNQRHQDAGEYGLERLSTVLQRKSSGKQLAQDLYHDGLRIVYRQQLKLVLGETAIQQAQALISDDKEYATQAELASSFLVLKKALADLQANERLALSLRVNGEQNEKVVKEVLSVGMRQYRKLASSAVNKLNSSTISKRAYLAIIDAFSGPHSSYVGLMVKRMFEESLTVI